MPGTYPPDGLGPLFRQILQRLRGLETQQQSVTSDNLGRPVKTTGLVPGSNPPLYGDMYYEPSTGAWTMFQGYDSGSDTAYIAWYDASRNVTTKVDATGFHFYNPSGTEEVRVGELNASPLIYGLGVLPQETGTPGALQMVGGKIFLALTPPGSVATGGVWTAFGGTNSVSFNVGPAGIFSLSVGSIMSVATAATVYGAIGFSLDGGTVELWEQFEGTALNQSASISAEADVSASAGSHTVEFYYQSSGGNMNISAARVTVEPL